MAKLSFPSYSSLFVPVPFLLSLPVLFDIFLLLIPPQPGSHRVSFSQCPSLHSFPHLSLPHPLYVSCGGLFIGSVSGRRLCLSCVPSRMHPSDTHPHPHTHSLSFFHKRWRRNEQIHLRKERSNDKKKTTLKITLSAKLYIIGTSLSASLLICHWDLMQLVDMCRRCRRSCWELFVCLEECSWMLVCLCLELSQPLFHLPFIAATHTHTHKHSLPRFWVCG